MTYTTSETERAYAAGLIDGEGCIRICHRFQKRTHVSEQFWMSVQVNATSSDMIDYLHSRWGGSKAELDSSQPNRRRIYRWVITSKQAAQFLEDIYPFLVVKKEQAMFARSFQVLSRRWGRHGGGRPIAILGFQRSVFEKMKELNKRGIAA